MTGCPYCKFNWQKWCEYCTVTNKPTGDAVKCDFGYEDECEEYKSKRKRKGEKSK